MISCLVPWTTHLDICRGTIGADIKCENQESKACAVAEINKKLRESKGIRLDVYLDDDLDLYILKCRQR